ncbi:MAG: riboflavin synthase [Pseudanabaenaceae cyanobacterium]
MFTGLVQRMATVVARTDSYLDIDCSEILTDLKVGDSVAVNGVCLTTAQLLPTGFRADISPETYRKTNLGDANLTKVNLELSLGIGDRVGGHFVSGHIDTVGIVTKIKELASAWEFTFTVEGESGRYLVYKGSVAVNGISLTVAQCEDKLNSTEFTVAVIPHTYYHTNLQFLQVGDRVNIETDILGKYVARILSYRPETAQPPITAQFLLEHGWV